MVDTVTLSPSPLNRLDTLTCTAGGSDADGDVPTLSFALTNQTSGQSYTPTVISGTEVTFDLTTVTVQLQDSVECTVTATDAHNGSSTQSVSAIVENLVPVFDSTPEISPTTMILTGTTVTCSALASDQKMDHSPRLMLGK